MRKPFRASVRSPDEVSRDFQICRASSTEVAYCCLSLSLLEGAAPEARGGQGLDTEFWFCRGMYVAENARVIDRYVKAGGCKGCKSLFMRDSWWLKLSPGLPLFQSVNMTLFVNINNIINWQNTYFVSFSTWHWDTWNDSFVFLICKGKME